MQHVWGKEAVRTGFWRENLRKWNDLEDPGLCERIILKRSFKKWDGGIRLDWSGSG